MAKVLLFVENSKQILVLFGIANSKNRSLYLSVQAEVSFLMKIFTNLIKNLIKFMICQKMTKPRQVVDEVKVIFKKKLVPVVLL